MADRQAMALIADDLLMSMTGKMVLHGIYTGHLTVPAEEMKVQQLVVLFLMEGEKGDSVRSIVIEVTLPNETPVRQEFPPMPENFETIPESTKWSAKFPLLISAPTLRPGRITARIIHDKGEISVGMPWIVKAGAPLQGQQAASMTH